VEHLDEISVDELAEWYDVHRKTISNWLTRLDTDESLEHAVVNTYRTGRNRKLSEPQQQEFEDAVHDPPKDVGIDAPAWTPALVQQFLADTDDVAYSIPRCRRLLKEAGLSYQNPCRSAAETDETEHEAVHDERKQTAGDGRSRGVYRPNQDVRAGRAACRVVSARYAVVRRPLWPARLDVLVGRGHRGR
jgi:transposase